MKRGPFRITARWVKLWLASAAFWLPFWWTAEFLFFALPSLASWLVLGERLEWIQIRFWMPMAVSGMPGGPAGSSGARNPRLLATHDLMAVAAGVLIVGAVMARRTSGGKRVLAGLGVSVAGGAGMLGAARFRGPFLASTGAGGAAAMLVLFGLICAGFRWMLSGWCPRRYGVRVASLLASFELPLALLLAVPGPLRPGFFRLSFWGAAYFLPGLAAALLVSLPKPGPKSIASGEGWRPAIIGAVTTVLLIFGIAKGGAAIDAAFRRHRDAENRAALAELPPIPVNAPYPKIFFQKGVSLSAEWPDPYASQGARQMLETLRTYGVDAVALVPYAGMREGSPEVRGFGPNSWESDEGLREMSRLAHALGIKVMLKPGVWVRGGRFAGDLDFPAAADREKFFADYGEFIGRYARLATEIHADLFCVGGEFVKLSPDERDWRKIIARVRELYPGPLTYAANFGGEFETLKFWDALDYIGLQDYYPLPENLSTDEEAAKVEAVERKFQKPVIFTEAGFPSAGGANRHPWEDGGPGRAALELQARCYAAIFRAFYSKPWFEGMYWWKVGTNGFGGGRDTSLTPWDKPAMEVVRKWYQDDSLR